MLLLLVLTPTYYCPHPVWHNNTINKGSRSVVRVELSKVVALSQGGRIAWPTEPSKQTTNGVDPGVTGGVLGALTHPVEHALVSVRVAAGWSRLHRLVSVWSERKASQ